MSEEDEQAHVGHEALGEKLAHLKPKTKLIAAGLGAVVVLGAIAAHKRNLATAAASSSYVVPNYTGTGGVIGGGSSGLPSTSPPSDIPGFTYVPPIPITPAPVVIPPAPVIIPPAPASDIPSFTYVPPTAITPAPAFMPQPNNTMAITPLYTVSPMAGSGYTAGTVAAIPSAADNQRAYLSSIVSDPTAAAGNKIWANAQLAAGPDSGISSGRSVSNQTAYLTNLVSQGGGNAEWASAQLASQPSGSGGTSSNQTAYLNSLVSQGGGNAAWASAQLASQPSGSGSTSSNQTAYLNSLVSQGGGNAEWAGAQLASSGSTQSNQQQYLNSLVSQGGGNSEWAASQLAAGNY